jgi:CheY-like chemotaxis protein
MPRVMLIDPDRTALAALQGALTRDGFPDVLAVTSGSFALTMLERNRPDLIVSRVGVPDIDGYELCSIVRKDPLMTGVLFLLLASPGDEAAPTMPEDKPDQTLAGDLPLTAIVSEVANLLGRAAQPAVANGEPAAPGVQPDGAHGLRGSLAVMELPDITQAIALGNKTGQLVGDPVGGTRHRVLRSRTRRACGVLRAHRRDRLRRLAGRGARRGHRELRVQSARRGRPSPARRRFTGTSSSSC